MSILSIDIGKKNLGYCLIDNGNISFGLFDIEKGLKKKNMYTRNIVVINWIKIILTEHNIEKFIVEKQVMQNVVAARTRSCLITVVHSLYPEIEIICFDPKLKFNGIKYNSKTKEHKKIIVNMARDYLLSKDCLNDFESYIKKDDISDAIIMAKIISQTIL